MASAQKKQRLALLVLIAACIAMAAAITFIQQNDSEQLITGLDKQTINQISIIQTNGQTILIEKQDDHWQITQPTNQAANDNRIEPLLSIAAITPSYASSDVNREEAGLTTPIASITFNDKQFDIGELDVSGKRRYAESDGQVYFFPEWIAPLLAGGLSALAAEPEN